MNKARQRPFAAIVQTHLDRRYPPIIVSHGAAIVTSSNAVSWEWLQYALDPACPANAAFRASCIFLTLLS
jgi:hypothetical protein